MRRVRLLIESGRTFRAVAQVTRIHFSSCYRWSADLTPRPRKPLTDEEKQNIRQALLERENRPLRELEREFGRNRSLISELRKEVLPFEAETVKEHRCPTCRAKITTAVCLRCSLKS